MWLRTAWWEVVGSELAAHHGRGIDIAAAFFSEDAADSANRARVADYFWRESGKWAQKQPPEGFGSLKFYGRWGSKEGFRPIVTEAELDEAAAYELRRILRRMQEGKLREAAARYGRRPMRGAGRSRGRDGLTVFDVDGRDLGPALLSLASQLALSVGRSAMKYVQAEVIEGVAKLRLGIDAQAIDEFPRQAVRRTRVVHQEQGLRGRRQ